MAADVSGNEEVSPFDASLIFRYSAGLIDRFPIEEPALYRGMNGPVVERLMSLETSDAGPDQLKAELILDNGRGNDHGRGYDHGIYSGIFVIHYDRDLLQLMRWQCPESTRGVKAVATEKGGYLKIAFASLHPLDEGDPLCELIFRGTDGSHLSLSHAQFNENRIPVRIAERVPATFRVYDNFPNPFNSSTTIRYRLPGTPESVHHVRISIFNVRGRSVRTLLDEKQTAGVHQVRWDGTSDSRDPMPSGVYFYRIDAGEMCGIGKITLIR
jgi:hypothetical protein